MPTLHPLSTDPVLAAEAEAALRYSHGVTSRVTLYLPDGTTISDVPHAGGTVDYDDTRAVRRTATVNISNVRLWSTSMDSPLSAVGPELGVEYGVLVPGRARPVWTPVFRGPIDESSRSTPLGAQGVAVTASDRTIKLLRDRFPVPHQIAAGTLVTTAITDLIRRTLPGATVAVLSASGDYSLVKTFTINRDPWADGVQVLADRIGVVVYADRTGGFLIEDVPTLTDAPVWVLDTGPGGALVALDQKTSNAKLINASYARGIQTDGTALVLGRAVVDDPARPDYWGTDTIPGPAGRNPRFYASSLITTQAQADAVAKTNLERFAGIYATCNPTGLPHPGLEPGLTISTRTRDGVHQRHLLSKVPIDLAGGAQALGTRTTDLPAEQENDPLEEEL